MFSVLNEIGNNSHFRTTAVVSFSIGISAFIYILVATTGYLSFGNAVGGNIVALCTLLHSLPFHVITTDLSVRRTLHILNNWQSRHSHLSHVLISTSSPSLSCFGRRGAQVATTSSTGRLQRLARSAKSVTTAAVETSGRCHGRNPFCRHNNRDHSLELHSCHDCLLT